MRLTPFQLVTPDSWHFTEYGDVAKGLDVARRYERAHRSLQGGEYKCEEFVRQWVLHRLVDAYGFPADWLGTRIFVEEHLQVGSYNMRTDISVKRQDRQTVLIIETKRRGISSGEFQQAVEQLKCYLSVCFTAQFGMVTDGDRTVCLEKIREPRDWRVLDDLPTRRELADLLGVPPHVEAPVPVVSTPQGEEPSSLFKVGRTYTRNTIHRKIGGDKQSYLPHVDGRVVCGCFTSKLNPGIPYEVLVGDAPNVVKYAKQVATQREPIPVFAKVAVNKWEYLGRFRPLRYTEDPAEVDHRAVDANRDWVAGVLFFEKAG